jgi:hypothetical protein
MKKESFLKRIFLYVPFILLNGFMLLYLYAGACYPGGNEFNRNAQGYSWASNFYCDLFHRTAYNGEINSARPVAFVSLVVLGAAFWMLWLAVVNCWFISGRRRWSGNLIGLLMVGSHFLMFGWHDLALKLMMFTGFAAFLYLGSIFWMGGKRAALVLTVIFILTSSVNFWAWALGFMGDFVPLAQKFTLGMLYVWGIYLNMEVIRYNRGVAPKEGMALNHQHPGMQ